MTVSSNTERFTGRVDTYDRYRMRYPAAPILATLHSWCGLTPSQTIADIGAGTGMLSEVFLQNGNTVLAVEPNAEMRAACEPLAKQFTKLTILDAAAEATTLPDSSVDLVAVGRAFHWFDQPRAIREFQRILKPGGWTVLLSASRARNQTEQSLALEQVLLTYSKDPGHTAGGHHLHEHPESLFPHGEILQRQTDGEERLTRDAFLGQTLSYSSAPLPTDPLYPPFLQDLQSIFDRYQHEDLIRIATTCWITCGRLSA